jgi:hypothetical protein
MAGIHCAHRLVFCLVLKFFVTCDFILCPEIISEDSKISRFANSSLKPWLLRTMLLRVHKRGALQRNALVFKNHAMTIAYA